MKLIEITAGPQDYKIFVDMDGVLSDFLEGVKKIYPEYTEHKYETDPAFRKEMWNKVKAHAKEGGELWFDLNPLSDMKQLWDYVKPYGPEILTATGSGVKPLVIRRSVGLKNTWDHMLCILYNVHKINISTLQKTTF